MIGSKASCDPKFQFKNRSFRQTAWSIRKEHSVAAGPSEVCNDEFLLLDSQSSWKIVWFVFIVLLRFCYWVWQQLSAHQFYPLKDSVWIGILPPCSCLFPLDTTSIPIISNFRPFFNVICYLLDCNPILCGHFQSVSRCCSAGGLQREHNEHEGAVKWQMPMMSSASKSLGVHSSTFLFRFDFFLIHIVPRGNEGLKSQLSWVPHFTSTELL